MGLLDLAFTPTELILLRGEKFAPRLSGIEGIKMLHADYDVSGPILAQTMLLAAILANEATGSLKVEKKIKTGIFGGNNFEILLYPSGSQVMWGNFSLEEAVSNVVIMAYKGNQKSDPYSLMMRLLGDETGPHWQRVIGIVEHGLLASDWLLPVKGDAQKAFSTPYICPAKVQELVSQQPIEVVGKLLFECKNTRPLLWKTLNEQIVQVFRTVG
jgi:hypothetical protein